VSHRPLDLLLLQTEKAGRLCPAYESSIGCGRQI